MTTYAPLDWPKGQPRTAKADRKDGNGFRRDLAESIDALGKELELLGAKDCELTWNRPPRRKSDPETDPGVAVRFDWKGKELHWGQDAYATPDANAASLARMAEGFRQALRHGGERLFSVAAASFAPLPEPDRWRGPLDNPATLAEAEETYRAKARTHHPDAGGDPAIMAELNEAIRLARTYFKVNR